MPTSHYLRRERGFRPVHYTPRHKLVAILRALGKTRREIAAMTGYSPWHVSRIAGMLEAHRDAEAVNTAFGRALIDRVLNRLLPAVQGNRIGRQHGQDKAGLP